ncbi:hypothetical protein [Acetobacter conturbans]|uniref:Uncharacterized protein n=1 Tax=Acetobacter conturbans TaxID=1737472 RepID=A0ABX0K4A3_9PROT|nr:hypothetical protein [Acetobacter conturbans]NHN89473.1 hypothetical protein [Acetobacter conturbans]
MENGRKQPFFLFPVCPGFGACVGTLPQFHMHTPYAYEIAKFFSFYRGIFAKQKSKPLFFSDFGSLAPAVRPDDGGDGVIFSGWAL